MSTEIEELTKELHSKIRDLETRRMSKIFMFVEGGNEHICHWQSEYLYRLKANGEFDNIERLEILLHSGGGHAECAYKIAKMFRNHCKVLNVIVPIAAKSAATLMCLAADEIYMSEQAELGPLDVQITDPVEKGLNQFSPLDEFKSMEFLREYALEVLDYYAIALVEHSGMSVKEAFHEAMPAVANTVAPLYQKVDPSKIGSYRRSLAVGEEYAKRLLKLRGISTKVAHKLAEQLVWKYPSHDFVIDRSEAKEIGLPVVELAEDQEKDFIEILDIIDAIGESKYEFAENNQTDEPDEAIEVIEAATGEEELGVQNGKPRVKAGKSEKA